MPTPAGPLIGGIQFDETTSGHLQGLAIASMVVQNPAGSEPAAVTVAGRSLPCVLAVRGLFANIPNVRAKRGTIVSCTVRGAGPTDYWCAEAEIVGSPRQALHDGSTFWVVDATFTLHPLA
jgi:hypothetical protein